MTPHDENSEGSSGPKERGGEDPARETGGRVRREPATQARRPRPEGGRGRAVRPRAATGRGRARPAATSPGGRRGSEGRKLVILSVVSVVVLAVAIGAFVLGQGAVSTGREAKQAQTSTTIAGPVPAADMTTFEDKEAGFTIQYPKAWQKLDTPVRDLSLVVTPGGQNYVSVRVQRTDTATTTENLKNVKAVTDGIIGSNETARVLPPEPGLPPGPKAVSINGMIGYYYLYTFTDENSGLKGAHAHYFLFQGHKMNSLVFQGLPTEEYGKLEPTYNQILASFRSEPEPVTPPPSSPAPATPTTVP